MNGQHIGYGGYRLYRLGWYYNRFRNLSLFQHWLLSFLCYYRLGFSDAEAWRQQLVERESPH